MLATSDTQVPAVLTWSAQGGGRDFDLWGRPLLRDRPPPYEPDVVVLYSSRTPSLRTRCPAGRCAWRAIETFDCDAVRRREVVVVAGHGEASTWLGRDADGIASAVACFAPRLVVVDTCFGANTRLLRALAQRSDALVVASPRIVQGDGLRYGDAFFAGRHPDARAAAVTDSNGLPLLRWRLDLRVLAKLKARVAAMSAPALRTALFRRNPACIRQALAGSGPVLIPIDPRRLGKPPSPRRPRRMGRRHRAGERP